MKKLIQTIKDTLSVFQSNKGFTLLELLVVVLIIGILASIALPQYESSVEKSKASEALLILKSLRDQQAVCYLEKGEGHCDCESGCGEGDNLFTYANMFEIYADPECEDPVCGYATKDFTYSIDGDVFYANRRTYGTKYYLSTSADKNSYAYNKFVCSNESDTKNYCKIIGFTKEENGNWYQP